MDLVTLGSDYHLDNRRADLRHDVAFSVVKARSIGRSCEMVKQQRRGPTIHTRVARCKVDTFTYYTARRKEGARKP